MQPGRPLTSDLLAVKGTAHQNLLVLSRERKGEKILGYQSLPEE
jgi:hypothetical protein